MTRRLDPRHIWNVISNARSNKCHLQTHHILRLPRKMTIQHLAEICGKQLKRHFQCAGRSEHDPNMIRSRSETVPRPFPSVRNPPRNRGYFSRSGRTVCIEKYNISRSGYLSKFHQVLRLPRKVTPQNFTKYCAYHAKWHLNFTKYCAYHAKWHLTFTNYCAYHAKWHLKLNQVLLRGPPSYI